MFGTGTPAAPNETDGRIALSTGFVINDAGTYWCTGVEFYAASSAPSGVSVALWSRVTDESPSGLGTLLASKALAAPVAGQRNRVLFDTPVQVTAAAYANGLYATVRTANNYVATGGYFASGPQTSGPITAYQNKASIGFNGRFKVGATGAADSYPTGTFGGGGYWVSPVITDVNPSGEPVEASLSATSPRATMTAVAVEAIPATLLAFASLPIMEMTAAQVEPISAAFTATSPRPVMSFAAVSSIVPASGSFEPLLDMVRNAKRQAGQRVRAVACPRCGTPLEHARGVAHCPMGDWVG